MEKGDVCGRNEWIGKSMLVSDGFDWVNTDPQFGNVCKIHIYSIT